MKTLSILFAVFITFRVSAESLTTLAVCRILNTYTKIAITFDKSSNHLYLNIENDINDNSYTENITHFDSRPENFRFRGNLNVFGTKYFYLSEEDNLVEIGTYSDKMWGTIQGPVTQGKKVELLDCE